MKKIIIMLLLCIIVTACQSTPEATLTESDSPVFTPSATSINIKADVWADNWFAFYLGEQLVKEDSVSITTERSFNSETFTFNAEYPLVLNFIMKDFKENDTGLEYIGANNQQMGDGGLIAQFTNTGTGAIIAVTDASWVCMVIHQAPLDKACEDESNPIAGEMPCGFNAMEEPEGWKSLSFDSSGWSPATIFPSDQVSPKDGYDQITWDSSAGFIWGPDLETDNTVLCRLIVTE